MCFSNMYFGLQTGWVTMGSLQSTILGFGVFKLLRPCAVAPFLLAFPAQFAHIVLTPALAYLQLALHHLAFALFYLICHAGI